MNSRLPESLWLALPLAASNRLFLPELDQTLAYLKENGAMFNNQVPSISSIPQYGEEEAKRFLRVVLDSEEKRQVWRPLLLFPSLPGRKIWEEVIGKQPIDRDWDLLKVAVAATIFHQSDVSTDCRWFSVASLALLGRLFLREGAVLGQAISTYGRPNEIDGARAAIRAAEIGINATGGQADTSEWSKRFWEDCRKLTNCEHGTLETDPEFEAPGTTRQKVDAVHSALYTHFQSTASTTDIDARHEATFGAGFYALALVRELLSIGAGVTIQARSALRSLVELRITISYLAKEDSPQIWNQYRNYGAGQAKLAFLKLDQTADKVKYVNQEQLEALANEDLWEEYRSIDLGNWQKSDLRKLAERANAKDDYDKYYDWPSAYLHGNWAAVRDVAFETCINPLHRLHRIPLTTPRAQPDVVADACKLADKVLDEVSKLYPDFKLRLKI